MSWFAFNLIQIKGKPLHSRPDVRHGLVGNFALAGFGGHIDVTWVESMLRKPYFATLKQNVTSNGTCPT